MSFDSLGLNPAVLSAVTRAGYTTATPVQEQAIPVALTGADMMVSAATGSGKTAAFMLPALHRLTEASEVRSIGPRILVLCPTRELAQQVSKASQTYGRGLKRLSVVTVVGGMPYPAQIKLLRQPVDVLVATPGRLLDYIGRGRIDFSRCEMLVLDEADRMLDMGFKEDIEQIFDALPEGRQTVMFSATFGGEVGRMATAMLNEPVRIELATQRDKHADIEQRVHWADDQAHKNKLLDHLLKGEDVNQAIVFAATKRDAEWLSESLADKGFSAASLHGDMPQAKRNRTLMNLRRGNIRVLVATDVAARGIDVPTISHVINYGMPMKAEDYVHRIGRTGRAGRAGIAITLAIPAERFKVRQIERFTTQQIPAHIIEGLEPRFKPEQRERRSFGDRPRFNSDRGERSHGDRPRSFGDRPQGDRPRFNDRNGERGFGDRPRFDGDRPRFNAERPQGDRPRFNSDRPQGDRPFGDRPRFNNEQRNYGDRALGNGERRFDKPQDRAQERPAFNRDRSSFGSRDERRPAGHGDRFSSEQRRSSGDRDGQPRSFSRDGAAPRGGFGDRNDRAPRFERDGGQGRSFSRGGRRD